MTKLKSCMACGRIHPINHICAKKEANRKEYNRRREVVKRSIRSSARWTNKSIEIRERDSYMCQMCIRKIEMLDGMKQYNYNKNIQVHHIIKIVDNESLVFENSNLITLCKYHHDLIENNKKYVNLLRKIADEQEKKYPSPMIFLKK